MSKPEVLEPIHPEIYIDPGSIYYPIDPPIYETIELEQEVAEELKDKLKATNVLDPVHPEVLTSIPQLREDFNKKNHL